MAHILVLDLEQDAETQGHVLLPVPNRAQAEVKLTELTFDPMYMGGHPMYVDALGKFMSEPSDSPMFSVSAKHDESMVVFVYVA